MTALRFQFRDHLANALAGVFAVAYLLSLALLPPGSAAAQKAGEIAFFPLGLVVGWLNLRNSRVPGLDSRTRWAWRLLAMASLALWFSGNAWSFWLHFNSAAQYPPWIDHLALVQYILFIAGYLCFPFSAQPRVSRVRSLLDAGLMVVAGFMLAFHFGLGALLRKTQLGGGAVNSILDWTLFVIAAVGFTRKRDAIARTTMGLLLAANCFYLLGNYVLSGVDQYVVGQPVDALWFCAWILRWTAASAAWQRYRAPVVEQDPVTDSGFREYRSNAFAYLLVFGAFLLLVVRVLQGEHRHLGVLAVSAALMAGLLILRQMAEFRENRRLFSAHLAQEARFKSLVQHSSEVVLVADPAGVITYASPSADRVFGEAGPVRAGARFKDLFHPEDAGALAAWLAGSPGAPLLFQGRMADAQGGWRTMEIQSSDLRDDPAVGGLVLTCRDVTERNELERQLQHAQKLDAVGKLAGGMAHDINNMLAVMTARLDLLEADGSLDVRQKAHLHSMDEAVRQSGEIIRQLLAFSRRQVIEPVVLDVNRNVAEACRTIGPLLGEEIDLALELDPELWRVKLDPAQLNQILVNLLLNAKDASHRGGRISLSTSNLRLDTPLTPNPAARPGDYVVLAVTDQGAGMDQETQARIFEPFFTTKPMGKGTGLGLSTVFGIVDQNGGFLNVYSEPGQGSTFRIYLPAVFERSDAEPALAAAVPAQETGLVLLVEDNDALREAIQKVLEQLGYQVMAAPGPAEAVELLKNPSLAFELLMTDVVMPGGNGKDLSDQAVRLKPGIRVLFMSGYTADVIAEKGVLTEGTNFIQKPFNRETVRRKLREVSGKTT